jgi:hypothetical protein
MGDRKRMHKENQPLAEVFGHLPTDFSPKANRYRKHKLCPFNNKVPSCTKDKAKDPLEVCSVYNGDNPVITFRNTHIHSLISLIYCISYNLI